MERAISQFGIFDNMSKKDIEFFVEQCKNDLEWHDRFRLLAQLQTLDEIVKRVKDLVKQSLIDEGQFEGQKLIERFGVKFEIANKKTYDYSNNAEWVELDAKMKKIESLMKTLDAPLTKVDDETGEITTIPPATWKCTETIKVTLKK